MRISPISFDRETALSVTMWCTHHKPMSPQTSNLFFSFIFLMLCLWANSINCSPSRFNSYCKGHTNLCCTHFYKLSDKKRENKTKVLIICVIRSEEIYLRMYLLFSNNLFIQVRAEIAATAERNYYAHHSRITQSRYTHSNSAAAACNKIWRGQATALAKQNLICLHMHRTSVLRLGA